jgi:hypothetical protein
MRLAPALRRSLWRNLVQGRLDWRSYGFVERANFGATFAGNTGAPGRGRDCPMLETRRTFIDIGVNIGYFTLLPAHLVGPNGRVVAAEASSITHSRLSENIRRNRLEKIVRAVRAAVADRDEILTLHSGPEDSSGTAD